MKVLKGLSEISPKMESTNVQSVYNAIAPHFSQTRYKPWPVIENFLESRAKGSLVADVGCGNGKYTSVNTENITYIASDFSSNLVSIASKKNPSGSAEFLVADVLKLPYRDSSVTDVICIAVIHHLTTPERRIKAVKEMLRVCRPGGQILIFVWALEQSAGSRFQFESQDVFVPWHNAKVSGDEKEYQRFYHVFRKGELEELLAVASKESAIPIEISQSGYDKDNWYIIATIQSNPSTPVKIEI